MLQQDLGLLVTFCKLRGNKRDLRFVPLPLSSPPHFFLSCLSCRRLANATKPSAIVDPKNDGVEIGSPRRGATLGEVVDRFGGEFVIEMGGLGNP